MAFAGLASRRAEFDESAMEGRSMCCGAHIVAFATALLTACAAVSLPAAEPALLATAIGWLDR